MTSQADFQENRKSVVFAVNSDSLIFLLNSNATSTFVMPFMRPTINDVYILAVCLYCYISYLIQMICYVYDARNSVIMVKKKMFKII